MEAHIRHRRHIEVPASSHSLGSDRGFITSVRPEVLSAWIAIMSTSPFEGVMTPVGAARKANNDDTKGVFPDVPP